jgi:hypothetical protein
MMELMVTAVPHVLSCWLLYRTVQSVPAGMYTKGIPGFSCL